MSMYLLQNIIYLIFIFNNLRSSFRHLQFIIQNSEYIYNKKSSLEIRYSYSTEI